VTDTYRVTAPYVTLRIRDDLTGSWSLRGFFPGAILPASTKQEDLDRHLRKTMIEKVDAAEAKTLDKAQAEADKAEDAAAKAQADVDDLLAKEAAKAAAEEAEPAKPAKATKG
jgi:hypothetical protein